MRPVLVLDLVGLTPRLLHSGAMPACSAFAREHVEKPLAPEVPAVTCTVQASMLTGKRPREHGAVANGWYFRDLAEVWLWRQSVRLITGGAPRPAIFERFRSRHPGARIAQLFWWWNLPSGADWSVTPRPTYWADGRKGPDVHGHPPDLRDDLQGALGDFPLFRFWGPGAGIESTRWIADAVIRVLEEQRPALTLGYLPHLDYDLQRHGPDGEEARRAAAQLDGEVARVLEAARARDARVVLVSEYGIEPVRRAVHPNRALREAGLLAVHPARNGALLDPGNSRAFAVCDHQCAHVYVDDPADLPRVRTLLADLPGVERVLAGEELAEFALDHPRSGELFLLAEEDAWFAYPYWAGDDRVPDFARTVDIHRKPGYDPCELFLDPARPLLKARLAAKLVGKRLGLRTLFDPVPLDASLVRGSHGRPPAAPERGPVWIGPEEWAPEGDAVSAHRALEGLAAD